MSIEDLINKGLQDDIFDVPIFFFDRSETATKDHFSRKDFFYRKYRMDMYSENLPVHNYEMAKDLIGL